MPELPELEIYRERLDAALAGRTVLGATLHEPFVLRTVDPTLSEAEGRTIQRTGRRGKFLLLELEGPLFLAFHLMLAGRIHLKRTESFRPHRRRTVLSLEIDDGTVVEMTEAGSKRRASLHVLADPSDLEKIVRGVEPLAEDLTVARLGELLRAENRQVKGALRDPSLLAGIGNAYSDEILFAARISPSRLTARLTDGEVTALHAAIRGTLRQWIERIRERCPEGLPVKQRSWRGEMSVHGKTGEPCPRCGGPVCRVSFQGSETNYCPDCQNEGRVLADRRLSRFGIRRKGA